MDATSTRPLLGQLTFDEPRARRSDPDTSHAAAASVQNVRASHEAVLAAFDAFGPMTDLTLARLYNEERMRRMWPLQSDSGLRTRRSELVKLGHVRDSGVREALPSGRAAIRWELA